MLKGQPAKRGTAFTLKVAHQANIILVISRLLEDDGEKLREDLTSAARYAAEQAGYAFDAPARCTSGLSVI